MLLALGSTHPNSSPTGQPAVTSTTSRSADGALESATSTFRQALDRVERSERSVDRAIRRISRGGSLDSGQLLAVQAQVYRASQQAELVSKAVDRVSDAVREVTQIKI